MRRLFGWIGRGAALNENRGGGGPWGGGSGEGGGAGGDGGSGPTGGAGDGGSGDGGGDPPQPPRSPWGGLPGPRRGKGGGGNGNGGGGRSDNVTSFEDWLKRGRETLGRGLPGGGGGGGVRRPYWLYGLIAFVLLWLAFTVFHVVPPRERGIVTTFGRYERTTTPGITWTWPAPISRFETVQVEEIREISIPNGERENLILTGDQNVIDLAYQVRWNVSDPQLYLFQMANPDSTIREVAESSMRAIVSRVSLEEALGSGRSEIEQRVRQSMQQLLDEYGAGVAIQGVSINQSSPPPAVNDAFLAVSAAQQRAQSAQNEARAYALARTAQAQGDAAQFEQIYRQYRLAPEVTRRRMYYETMEQILAATDVTIVEAAGVAPYLPLPELQRRQRLPTPPPAAAAAPAPAPAQPQRPQAAQPAQPQAQQGGTR